MQRRCFALESDSSCMCRKKEARLAEEKLRATKTLGEPAQDEDLLAWVGKTRALEAERAKAARTARLLQEQVCPCLCLVA